MPKMRPARWNLKSDLQIFPRYLIDRYLGNCQIFPHIVHICCVYGQITAPDSPVTSCIYAQTFNIYFPWEKMHMHHVFPHVSSGFPHCATSRLVNWQDLLQMRYSPGFIVRGRVRWARINWDILFAMSCWFKKCHFDFPNNERVNFSQHTNSWRSYHVRFHACAV